MLSRYHYLSLSKVSIYTHPLLLMSNILKATEKLDSGILSNVTKKIYLLQGNIKEIHYTKSIKSIN